MSKLETIFHKKSLYSKYPVGILPKKKNRFETIAFIGSLGIKKFELT